MNRSQSRLTSSLLVAFFIAWGATAARAATITVPGDEATIQDAINAAADGDTILVDDGTYTENIVVDVDNLTIISVNGPGSTTIEENTNNPIVDIQAKGVTIGAPNQGFTIHQKYNGNTAVLVEGNYQTGTSTTTIQNNDLVGKDSDEGVYVNPVMGGVNSGDHPHLIVQNNDFSMDAGAATYGFNDVIYFEYGTYTGPMDVAVFASDVDILNNTATDYSDSAVNFSANVFRSTVNITDCDFTGISGGASYGIYCDDSIRDNSALNISGTAIDDIDDAVYISSYVENASSLSVTGSDFTNVHDDGVYVSSGVYYGSDITVDPCTISGDGAGAVYGIYLGYLESACTFTCTDNTIDGFDYSDVYISSGPYYRSTATITGNDLSITADGSSAYGIYMDTEYNSQSEVRDNTVSGFDYCGIYEAYPYGNASTVIDNNTFDADSAGADYGIWVDEVADQSTADVTNNTATDFTSAGYYNGNGVYYNSKLTFTGNTLTARAAGGGAGFGIDFDNSSGSGNIEDGSQVLIDGNTISGFNDTGLYVYGVEENATLTCTNNTFTADSGGCTDGMNIYFVDYGSTVTVTNNTVSGFGNQGGGETGFDQYYSGSDGYVEDGSTLVLSDNTFTAHSAGADYGIYTDGWYYGVNATINNNTFTGIISEGAYIDYGAYDGCNLTMTGNTFTAQSGGMSYGLDFYYDYYTFYDGSNADVSNNLIDGYTDYGIYCGGVYDGCNVKFDSNTLNQENDGSGTVYGFYIYEQTQYGSVLEITNNTLNHVTDPEPGNSSVYAEGIDTEGATEGSLERVNDNQINCQGTGETTGIYLTYSADYGSEEEVLRNTVNGATDVGLYVDDDTQTGGTLTVANNKLSAENYGIYYSGAYVVSDGGLATFYNNTLTDFTLDGFYFGYYVYGATLTFQANRVFGNAADHGCYFGNDIYNDGKVNILDNCFTGVDTGVEVSDIFDSASCNVHQNDFDGVAVTGVINNGGDADHEVDASHNFFGSVPTQSTGFVYTAFALAAAPDSDGDGVANCDDKCPDTAAGDSVNADGCSCIQLDPTTDTDGDGTIDCLDGCPNDANKVDPGQCGCGNVEGPDTDGDGTLDCVDGCPNDPNKTSPGSCGCGNPETDTDGDGVPDCVDNCPLRANADQADGDGDGIGDVCDAIPFCGLGLYIPFPIMLTGIVLAKVNIRRRRRQ